MKPYLTILILVFLVQTRKLDLSCGDCSISCNTGDKCYKLEGNDGKTISEEICVGASICPMTTTFEYNAVNCDADFAGNSCSTGACVYPSGVTNCDPTGAGCSSGVSAKTERKECSQTPGCSYCLVSTTSGVSA